jgi:hypothetical protein
MPIVTILLATAMSIQQAAELDDTPKQLRAAALSVDSTGSFGTVRIVRLQQGGALLSLIAVERCSVSTRQRELYEDTMKTWGLSAGATFWIPGFASTICESSETNHLELVLAQAAREAFQRLARARMYGIKGSIDSYTIGGMARVSSGGTPIASPIDPELTMLRIETMDGQPLALLVAGALAVEHSEAPAINRKVELAIGPRVEGGPLPVVLVAPLDFRSVSRLPSLSKLRDSYSGYIDGVVGRWSTLAASPEREELSSFRFTNEDKGSALAVVRLGQRWALVRLSSQIDPSLALFLKEEANGVSLLLVGDPQATSTSKPARVGWLPSPDSLLIPAPAAEYSEALLGALHKGRGGRYSKTQVRISDGDFTFDRYRFGTQRRNWQAGIRAPALLGVQGMGNGRSVYLEGGSLELTTSRRLTSTSLTFWLHLGPSPSAETSLVMGFGVQLSLSKDSRVLFQGKVVEAKGILNNAWNHVAVAVLGNRAVLYVNGVTYASAETLGTSNSWNIGGRGSLRVDTVKVWDKALSRRSVWENFERPSRVIKAQRPFPFDNPFPIQPGDPDRIERYQVPIELQ